MQLPPDPDPDAALPLGVILAGGQARRMGGGDKALLPLGGRRVIDHVISALRPQVRGLALNANGDPARFADLCLPVLADPVPGFAGPLAGVLAGLDWAAAQGVDRVVSVAADTPFLPADLVARLRAAVPGSGPIPALAATPGSEATRSTDAAGSIRHPTCALWPVGLRGDLRSALALGTRKVVLWAEAHGAVEALFDRGDEVAFFNINTPEDLARAEAML